MQDEEKYPVEPKVVAGASDKSSASVEDEIPPYMRDASKKGVLAKLRGWEEALDRKIGVETHGISRRRPEDRDPAFASWSNQAVMFLVSAPMKTPGASSGATYGFVMGFDTTRCTRPVHLAALVAWSTLNHETSAK